MIWWSRGLVDLALTGYLWATVQALTELSGRRIAWPVPTRALLVAGWAAHTLGLALRGIALGRPPVGGLHGALSTIVWAAVLLLLWGERRHAMRSLPAFVLGPGGARGRRLRRPGGARPGGPRPLHRARPRSPRRELRGRPHVRPPGAGAQARPAPRPLPAPAAAGRARPLLLPRPRRGLPVPDARPRPRAPRGCPRLRAGLALAVHARRGAGDLGGLRGPALAPGPGR